jgi:hypothetical protein
MAETTHIPFAQLLDWVEGRLSAHEASSITTDLAAADRPTQANLGWIQAFQAATSDIQLVAPPSSVRTLLESRFAAYARTRQTPNIVQQLIAFLSFDSYMAPTMAGVRSGQGPSGQRQYVYATDDADIALNFRQRPSVGDYILSGQVFPKGPAVPLSLHANIQSNDQAFGEAEVDDLGEFVFEGIPPGEYELTLSNSAIQILIAPIMLDL